MNTYELEKSLSNQVIDNDERDELKELVNKWLSEELTILERNRMIELEEKEWG